MSDIRSKTEQYLDSLPEEKLKELLDLAMLQTKQVYREITCRHCERRQKVLVDVPLPSSIAKAIKDLGEFTKGKVPERHVVDVNHWVGKDMRDWPEEALRAVASGEVIEDAEYEALPERSSG